MSSVSSSSSFHPSAVSGGIVGWSVDSKTVEKTVLAAVPLHMPTVLAILMASYVPDKQKGVFADNDWNELCGKVTPAPPLPLNIEKIWEGLCPIFPGKKVKESHVLMYLPTTVNDKPLTLKTLGEIAKQRYFPDSERGYRFIGDKIIEQMGDQSMSTAGWALITQTIINGSRTEKDYEPQQIMIKELAKKVGVPYTIPTVLEATIRHLTHCIRTPISLSSTRCQESIDGHHLVVGGPSSKGLHVSNGIGLPNVGVFALRKF